MGRFAAGAAPAATARPSANDEGAAAAHASKRPEPLPPFAAVAAAANLLLQRSAADAGAAAAKSLAIASWLAYMRVLPGAFIFQESPALLESVLAFLSLALVHDPSVYEERFAAAAVAELEAVDGVAKRSSFAAKAAMGPSNGPWGPPGRNGAVGFLSALAWLPPGALRLCLL